MDLPTLLAASAPPRADTRSAPETAPEDSDKNAISGTGVFGALLAAVARTAADQSAESSVGAQAAPLRIAAAEQPPDTPDPSASTAIAIEDGVAGELAAFIGRFAGAEGQPDLTALKEVDPQLAEAVERILEQVEADEIGHAGSGGDAMPSAALVQTHLTAMIEIATAASQAASSAARSAGDIAAVLPSAARQSAENQPKIPLALRAAILAFAADVAQGSADPATPHEEPAFSTSTGLARPVVARPASGHAEAEAAINPARVGPAEIAASAGQDNQATLSARTPAIGTSRDLPGHLPEIPTPVLTPPAGGREATGTRVELAAARSMVPEQAAPATTPATTPVTPAIAFALAETGPAMRPWARISAGPDLALIRDASAVARSIADQALPSIVALPERGRVEIQLDPRSLGRLDISMDLADGHMKVVIQAERPATLDLLRRHGDILTQQLQANGFGDIDLSFSADTGRRYPDRPIPAAQLHQADPSAPGESSPSMATVLLRTVTGDGGLDLRL